MIRRIDTEPLTFEVTYGGSHNCDQENNNQNEQLLLAVQTQVGGAAGELSDFYIREMVSTPNNYVLRPEGKDQIGSEIEQSAYRRAVPRSSTILPNDPRREDAEEIIKRLRMEKNLKVVDSRDDFNAVTSPQNRLFGNPVSFAETKDFNECIQEANLTELPWKGDYYTWSNKQQGTDIIYSRIDKLFGNGEWISKWGHVVTEYDCPNVLDHAPMLLTIKIIVLQYLGITQQIRLYCSKRFSFSPGQQKEILLNLEKWDLIEESVMKQKARVDWIKLRDSNTKYFSSVLKEKTHRKQITELTSLTGAKLEDVADIKKEIRLFYKGLMGSSAISLPAVNKKMMKKGPQLTHAQQLLLCKEVTTQEIEEGLQASGSDKAPGVDGYNAGFFKKAWPIIKQDVVVVVQEFFIISIMHRPINCTGITLVPKSAQPVTVKEYRPIACCTVLYKIISKVLATRLQQVISDVISDSQTGFIPGRKIADNIILAHELVQTYGRKQTSPRCILKIDLQKAYDSIEWVYLQQVMEELGFPMKFMAWIMECVKTINYSIVVNGEFTKPFDAVKGLRQGDPISPFLFSIAMEYLSRSLCALKLNKNFKFHPTVLNRISHTCALLMIYFYLQWFSCASGLKANLDKSCAYFGGVPQRDKDVIIQKLGYNTGELPFKYLGVSLSTMKLTLLQWQPLIEKIVKRIASWKTKKLSYAGRIQLVQTVIFGIQSYWAQLFLLPTKVVKTIEAYCRSYVWSGVSTITKKALVAWDKICLPKSAGGLNIINLHLWNKADQTKIFWDLTHKEDKLWIHTYYIKEQQVQVMPIPSQACWITRKILEARTQWNQVQHLVKKQHGIIKQIYLGLIGGRTRVSWKCLMFANSARPKVIFTMWLLVQAKLLTKDRLVKWDINVDPLCIFCQQENETREHLFVKCPFARRLWSRILNWMQRQENIGGDWDHHYQWILKNARGKTQKAQIFNLVFAETVHALWIERNVRIFEQEVMDESGLTRNIANVCNIRAPLGAKDVVQSWLVVLVFCRD
ncbi:uncharacterized protein LOC125867303 [Solanum stenotomum]|uniref:uncharacterized protein LOC125867303 n=1 Tax=Solanum stenotomum TaxID=172797 RepID=UPI0020D0AA3D|nr:uncharacterized protein LOC125867303 [Solanum stenotomum]